MFARVTKTSRPTIQFSFGVLLACSLLSVGGCASKPPKPVQTRTYVSVSRDANPDAKGRPSPIVVRIFELRTDTEFNGADFFALYERDKDTLGAAYVMREEYVLQPGEQREVAITMSRDARYIGAIAAFRDIRNSRWRAISIAPRKTTGDVLSKDWMAIDVERGSIKLTVKD